jgi:hypothetical protein
MPRQRSVNLGETEVKKRKPKHKSLMVKETELGGYEVCCPSCEEWINIREFFIHPCKKPIVERK